MSSIQPEPDVDPRVQFILNELHPEFKDLQKAPIIAADLLIRYGELLDWASDVIRYFEPPMSDSTTHTHYPLMGARIRSELERWKPFAA